MTGFAIAGRQTGATSGSAGDFILPLALLRARRNVKWNKYPPDVLPAWVADMDFAVAPPVQQAIERLVSQQDYGYGSPANEGALADAFAERMSACFGWNPDRDRLVCVADLVQAITVCLSVFSEPGDGVVIQTPIYPQFLKAVSNTGRRLVANPMIDDGSRFIIDLDQLSRLDPNSARILLFCNPHNPSGRVFERSELLALGDIAIRNDWIVISDEIHADLLYEGAHIPFASLSAEFAARTITITSATKAFNLPALRTALIHFGSADLLRHFHSAIPDRFLGQVSSIGVEATVAAWRDGQRWLDAVLALLKANRDRMTKILREELPEIRFHPPEATYLGWLDCRGLALKSPAFQFFLDTAKVAFSDGTDFGAGFSHCVRMNFGTSPEVLGQLLERMVGAIRQRP